ncbi:MAG: hypothetical protein LKI24_15370 [Acidipropionibacterium sp.]|jgi:hypothetical protein|nr:hypothetical protein [Acidipropionibacterium sp.]
MGSQMNESGWDRMADWAESEAPLIDDSAQTVTGAEAQEVGRRFLMTDRNRRS